MLWIEKRARRRILYDGPRATPRRRRRRAPSEARDHRVESLDVQPLRGQQHVLNHPPALEIELGERVAVIPQPMLLALAKGLQRGGVAEQLRGALDRLDEASPRSGRVVGLSSERADPRPQLLCVFP